MNKDIHSELKGSVNIAALNLFMTLMNHEEHEMSKIIAALMVIRAKKDTDPLKKIYQAIREFDERIPALDDEWPDIVNETSEG